MVAAFHRDAIPNPATVLAVAVLLVALFTARFRIRWLGWWERPLARLGRHRKLAILAAALSPLVMRALLLPWFPAPEPRLHDEFTFLLAADTFVHGRVVNPAHPNWVHFESIHIFAYPVYASVFPIAQAVAMAAGKLAFGHPWAGVWLGTAFLCGTICWMLQGWLPPRWALLGATLVVLRFGVSSYWMNSYWGGCVAAAGGALVLGALPRVMRTCQRRHAIVMGAGLAILANSRPFEGAVFGIAAGVLLLMWWRGDRPGGLSYLPMRLVVPLFIVLALTAAGMAYYFARVTGKPWLMPYVLYRNSISLAPHFVWQTPGPEPLFNNTVMRRFYVYWEMDQYLGARQQPFEHLWEMLGEYWRFYLGPLLTIPLLAAPFLWADRRTRALLVMGVVFCLALVGQVWKAPHYAAPAAGLVILIVVLGMRRLRLWKWWGRAVGLDVVRFLPVACAILLLVQIALGPVPGDQPEPPSWRWPSRLGDARASLLRHLESSPGKHLVLVRYDDSHDSGDEWVYNGADIDGSRVVWARELDAASNQKLMEYFADRTPWLVEPDQKPPRLRIYRDAPMRPMPFVQLGAPGIEALRSVEGVRHKVLQVASEEAAPSDLRSCYQWNFLFVKATGVAGPVVTNECSGGSLENRVPFDRWFSWLERQR